jgi:transcriptional regulator
MKHYDIFQPSEDEIDALVANHPLAQVVSCRDGNLVATPIPLLLSRPVAGPIELLGHLSKANPQVDDLRSGSTVLIVFQGADAYISPSWYRDRSKAPTWNYATVQFLASVEMLSDPGNGHAAITALATAMEDGRHQPWTTSEMDRYERALQGITTFRAKVIETRARFKLGQNDPLEKLQDSLAGLESDGKAYMAKAMRMANRQRLAAIAPAR